MQTSWVGSRLDQYNMMPITKVGWRSWDHRFNDKNIYVIWHMFWDCHRYLKCYCQNIIYVAKCDIKT